MLLIGYCYAHAQNSSALPYINSTQLYRVPMADINNNTYEWQISNPSYNAGSPITLDAQPWVTHGTIDVDVDSAYIYITFVTAVFESAGTIIPGTWTLTFSEFNGSNCEAVRSFDIELQSNQFNLAVEQFANDCNTFAGQVWDNSDDLTDPRDMLVELQVNLIKASNHFIRQWSFTGTVGATGGTFSLSDPLFTTITGNTVNNRGQYNIVWTSGNTFTLTVTVDAEDVEADYTTDAVNFEMNINGPAITDVAISFTITNVEALSGTFSQVTTLENNNTDNSLTQTLWGIPNTSVIAVSP